MDAEIIRMTPMHVAAYCAKGIQPEILALERLRKWAEENELLFGSAQARLFGFNNPDPQPGNPVYGYEVWLEVPLDVKGEGEITIIDFRGGLYACTEVKGVGNIFPAWQELLAWQKNSRYELSEDHPCLEEHLSDLSTPEKDFKLKLYLPLKG